VACGDDAHGDLLTRIAGLPLHRLVAVPAQILAVRKVIE